MKAATDCIPCMFQQALNTTRVVTADSRIQRKVLEKLARRIGRGLSFDESPATLSEPIYSIVSELTGCADPYRRQKRETNATAMKILPSLRKLAAKSKDPLDTALRIAAAGNIIDLGIGHSFNIDTDIKKIMQSPFAIHDGKSFRRELKSGRKLLYLGDNSGEIVFDTLLVEYLLKAGLDVTFVVKSGPIINDATMEDARAVAMTKLVRVIETGASCIGVNWRTVSRKFVREFEAADVIIGKGHGNFETCNTRPENIFFLLKCKCAMVAAELGVKLGDMVFKHNKSRTGS